MEILPGDVLFVWGNGPIEEAIEWVTHGPSHCAIFIDANTVAECQWNKKTGATPIADYLAEKGHRLEVWGDESLSVSERARMVDYAKNKFGTKYDRDAILAELAHFELGITLSDKWNKGKEYICSFYVNDCGKSVGRRWSKVNAPAPIDLQVGGKLKKKGVLKDGR